ncbi:MAG: AtpZ/AtpI family protein [Candidatus Caldarchaeum sp.]
MARRQGNTNGWGWAKYLALGTELAVSVVAGMYLGSLVDKWLGTKTPWFTLLGLIAGLCSGVMIFVRMLRQRGNNGGG